MKTDARKDSREGRGEGSADGAEFQRVELADEQPGDGTDADREGHGEDEDAQQRHPVEQRRRRLRGRRRDGRSGQHRTGVVQPHQSLFVQIINGRLSVLFYLFSSLVLFFRITPSTFGSLRLRAK